MNWFQALLPREDQFFDLFEAHAQTLASGADALRAALNGGDETPGWCEKIVEHEHAADEVEKLEAAIEDLFTKKLFDEATGKWNGIALKACMSISEDDLPVSKARLLTQWRLEYMTLKADEEQIGALD